MRTPEKQLVIADPNNESLFGAFGISEERGKEICKIVEGICKAAPDEAKHSDTIKQVWDTFEDENEAILAIYMLSHGEEEVVIQDCFGTAVVGDEEEEEAETEA